jgi:hypothetical protein
LDKFAAVFSVAGEKAGKGGGRRDGDIAEGFLRTPGVEKAKAAFERAQRVEERFHKDSMRSISLNGSHGEVLARCRKPVTTGDLGSSIWVK